MTTTNHAKRLDRVETASARIQRDYIKLARLLEHGYEKLLACFLPCIDQVGVYLAF